MNVASRVQYLSQGGDLVISESLASDPSVAALLEQEEPTVEQFTVELKGVGGVFALRRLWPPQPAPGARRG